MEKSISVVVVDNFCENRKIFQSALLSYDRNLNIEYASDGKTAIELCKKHNPRIIITDIFLPNADGFSILESLADSDAIKIVTTLVSNESIIKQSFDFGADYVFVKPLDERIVKERISDIINGKASVSNKNKTDEMTISKALSAILTRIGVPVNIQGFKFLKFGIIRVIENQELLKNITGKLYPIIAANFNSTPSRVERNIRTSIEVAYNRGNTDLQNEIFGYTIDANKGKPTNSEFIAMIADRIMLDFLRVD